jgi:hypothetical protein
MSHAGGRRRVCFISVHGGSFAPIWLSIAQSHTEGGSSYTALHAMELRRYDYADGGRKTEVANTGSCETGYKSAITLKRPGRSGKINVDRVEKSSEIGSDLVSTSALSRPISVTGTPSICVTTQIQSNMMRHATPLVQYEEQNVPGAF